MSERTDVSRGWRLVGWVGWGMVVAALGALGWLWRSDRARVWESPRLGPPLVILRAAASSARATTWLVAVNPDCPHCRDVLTRLSADSTASVHVGALIVDTPRRPAPATVAALPGSPIWWDARNDWRRRWGHRVYGEVMRFDARGRYLSARVVPVAP